jgi:hypothetical protein
MRRLHQRTILLCEAGSGSISVECPGTSLELIRKAECYDRETRFVRLYVYQRICSASQQDEELTSISPSSQISRISHVTMNIAQHGEEACSFKGTGEGTCILEVAQCDVAIALETKTKQVEILRDDRMRRSREVQRERVFHRSKVVELKNEVFGEILWGAPDHPAHSNVAKTKLVTRRVDGNDTRDFEVPFQFGVSKRCDKGPRCTIHCDRTHVSANQTGVSLVIPWIGTEWPVLASYSSSKSDISLTGS